MVVVFLGEYCHNVKHAYGSCKVTKQDGNPARQELLDRLVMKQSCILIADDDEQSQKMLNILIGYAHHAVKFASNGVEAVQIVASEDIDLVLMDVQMPIMGGLEATRQIRKWENGRSRLPIIGLTAVLDSEYEQCFQAGMDDIIPKPFDPDQLLAVILAHLDKKSIVVGKLDDPETSDAVILDVQGAIQRFAGDRDNYKTLLEEFVLSLPDRLEQLIGGYEAGEWQDLSNCAHNLKGLSANLGAVNLSRKAFELEQCIDENQYDRVKQTLEEISVCAEHLRFEAFAFIGNRSIGSN
jgi:CheY-like chemotaxis protein